MQQQSLCELMVALVFGKAAAVKVQWQGSSTASVASSLIFPDPGCSRFAEIQVGLMALRNKTWS